MKSYSVRQKFSSAITLLALLVSLAPPFPAMAQARSEPLPAIRENQPQLEPIGRLGDNFLQPAESQVEAVIPAGPQTSPAAAVDLAAAAGLFLTHPAAVANAPARPEPVQVDSSAWGQDYNFPRQPQAMAGPVAAQTLMAWPELAKLDLAAVQATPSTTASLESLPEINGPVTTTDPEGYFSFGNLPKGTHKVTLDPASLPLELRPLEGEAMPVLWLNPGQELTSAALASGVRFTATYDRASGNLSGLVFVDQNGDGQFDADETGLPHIRVIDPSVHQYFVPFDDRNLSALFIAKNGGSCHGLVTAVSPNILSSIFLTSGLNGTIIYYDHWEDGYDLDPLTPGPTTEVYVRNAGETVVFNDLINPLQVGAVPPLPGRPYYDGRDRITTFGEYASVVRFAYPETVTVTPNTFPGVLAGAAWEIAEVADWGTEYSTIVGEDLDFNGAAVDDHDFTGLSVMAAQDNTTVFYNGAEIATLNAGQVYFVNGANDGPDGGGVDSTDIITATAPVQVQLLSGTCSNQGWSSNGYSLNNRNDLYNAYWAPVPGFNATCNTADPYNVDTDIYLNNPNDTALVVNVVSGANTANITIPPRTTASVLSATGWADLADGNAGTRLSAAAPFAGLSVINSTTSNPATTGTTSDWGYTLIPEAELSSQVIVGYAPGVDPTTALPQDNSNLAFVTAVVDTVIFVDLENDGVPDNFDMNGDGDALDPAPLWGQPDWDETTSSNGVRVNAGQVLRVGDPTDLNLIGARIYTRDPAERIAVAWGQDPCRARRAAPSLDLGYTILPAPLLIPALAITKTRITPSPAPVGATVQYRIELQNVGQTRLITVPLTDTYDTTYLAFTGATPAADDNNNDGILNWANLGPLAISQTIAVTLSFTALASTRSEPGQVTPDTASASAIDENGAGVPPVSDDAEVRIVAPDFTITKTLTTPSPVPVGAAIQYEIVIENTGETNLVTVPLTDTYDTDYITYINANPSSLDNNNDGVINWTNVGPIDVGARVTVTLNFTAAASTQDLTNRVTPDTATASAVDENGAPVPPKSDDAEVEITEADLAITKVRLTPSPVAVGDSVQFQIVVANTGNTTLVTVPLTDTYNTTYLTYSGANPPSDDNDNDGQINWTQIGPINVGGRVTITVDFIAVTSTLGLPGNVTPNTATTSAVDEFGTSLRERQATDVVAIDVPALDFDKRVSPEEGSMVEPGQTLQYTLCYSNTGNRLATGVVITDSIPFNTTFVSGSATVDTGSVEYNDGNDWSPTEPISPTDVVALRWLIGDLPGNSGQRCVSFEVTINTTLVAPAAGLTVQYSPDGWIVVEGATSDLEIIGYTTPAAPEATATVTATPTITPTPEITATPEEVTATSEATATPAEPATPTPTVEATETPTLAEPATPTPEATAEETATETSTPPAVTPTDSATSEPAATETVAPEATPPAEPTSEATPAEEGSRWPQLTVIRAGAANPSTYVAQAAVFQAQISPTETTEPEPADPVDSPTPTAEATATEPAETPPAESPVDVPAEVDNLPSTVEVQALTSYPIIPLETVELIIINSATIDSNETPPITDTVSNPILRIIDPRLTKVGDPDRARPGDRVEYRIEVWNPAPPANANATDVIVVDALPPQLTLIGYSVIAPPGVTVIDSRVDGLVPIVGHPRGITQSLASTITLEIPALPPLPDNQRVRLFVTTQVNDVADPPPVDIINQATLSFTEGSERVGSDSVNVPPVRPPRRDRDDDDDDDEVAAPPPAQPLPPPATVQAEEFQLPVTFLPETGLLVATGPLNGWTTGITVIGLGVLGSFGAVVFYLWRKRRQDK